MTVSMAMVTVAVVAVALAMVLFAGTAMETGMEMVAAVLPRCPAFDLQLKPKL